MCHPHLNCCVLLYVLAFNSISEKKSIVSKNSWTDNIKTVDIICDEENQEEIKQHKFDRIQVDETALGKRKYNKRKRRARFKRKHYTVG